MPPKFRFPAIVPVRQVFRQPTLDDPAATLAETLRSSRLRERLRPGARVALAVGSRGLAGLDALVARVVAELRDMGFVPEVVAAMGSHGGGTSEGQRDLLAALGVTESAIGCPVVIDLETTVLGTNSFGLPIHFSRRALAADGLILLNRIKPHTSFTGRFESGLIKMLSIGLGLREGAAQVHRLGLPGLDRLIPEVGALLLERAPVVLGLAILENASDQTAAVYAIEPEEILDREPVLLDQARRLMPRLPFDQIDTLIVGELGKNYSGTGLDPHVIGRQRVETQPDLDRPRITRLAVLDLAPESHGNALGIGLADLTTRRLLDALDPRPMRLNAQTSNFLARTRIPIALPTDRDALQTALQTCWRVDPAEVRMVLIPNTLQVEHLWITEPLLDEARALAELDLLGDLRPIPFGPDDRLDQEALFPQSIRANRCRVRDH